MGNPPASISNEQGKTGYCQRVFGNEEEPGRRYDGLLSRTIEEPPGSKSQRS